MLMLLLLYFPFVIRFSFADVLYAVRNSGRSLGKMSQCNRESFCFLCEIYEFRSFEHKSNLKWLKAMLVQFLFPLPFSCRCCHCWHSSLALSRTHSSLRRKQMQFPAFTMWILRMHGFTCEQFRMQSRLSLVHPDDSLKRSFLLQIGGTFVRL